MNMKKQLIGLLVAASLGGMSLSGFAQEGPGPDGSDGAYGPGGPPPHAQWDPRGPAPDAPPPGPHPDWRRGDRVPPEYRVPQYVVDDWRGYQLQPPPSGYQWLQVNGEFVLAAIGTGVIASVLLGPHP